MNRRRALGAISTGLLPHLSVSGATINSACAHFPCKAISLIVPSSAGGELDRLGRELADGMQKVLDVPVIVEDVGGASGALGATRITHATPDGYAILLGGLSEIVLTPLSSSHTGYASTDFEPIRKIASTSMALIAGSSSAIGSVDELIDVARSSVASFTIGTAGEHSIQAVGAAELARTGSIDFTYVPYRGGQAIFTDLAAGRIDLAVVALPAAIALHQAGRAKVIGLLSRTRSAACPQFPTVNESRYVHDLDLRIWLGLFAPRGVDTQVLSTLHGAVETLLQGRSFRKRQELMGIDIAPFMSPNAFKMQIAEDLAKFRAIFQAAPPSR